MKAARSIHPIAAALRRLLTIFAAVAVLIFSASAFAHEIRPAYLELRQTAPDTYDALWKIPGQGENLRLGLYVELPAGCTNVTQPRGSMINNAYSERWTVKCPGGLTGGTIHIAGLSGTVVDVLVRLESLDGRTQVIRLTPSAPSFIVEATPSRWRVAATYLRLGTDHILMGVDHLLFVLGLLLIVGNRWMLFKTITAFTVAHSLTLAVATMGYASAPLPPLNAAIALSILFLGPEIVRVWRGQTSLTIQYPWVVAFVFGLLHGFGFASGLKATGLPQTDIAWALLLFNVGVEIGQVFFVFLILGLARSYRQLEIRWPRWALALPGYTVGTLGAFWTIQRAAILLGFIR
jgi:hydrogenase/urease accessory protein HupE